MDARAGPGSIGIPSNPIWVEELLVDDDVVLDLAAVLVLEGLEPPQPARSDVAQINSRAQHPGAFMTRERYRQQW
jgi:hypothetical protein